MNSIDVILQLTKGLDHPCPPEGAKLLSAYYALTLEKGKELAAHALEIEDQDTCSVLLLNLALLVPGSLAEIYPQILHRDLFEWEKLFLGAGPDICEAIVQRLKREQDFTKKLLCIKALAWAGTEFAQQILAEMTSQTIQVGSEKILTEEIIPCAGWELTEDGERRDLYFQESCALEFVETPHSNFHTESCPWCGQRLLLPFRFDLSDPRLAFLDMEGNQLHIATCANCVNLSAIYMHLDTHGKAKWSTSNTRPDIVRDDYGPVGGLIPLFSSNRLALGEKIKSPYEHEAWVGVSAYKIGGLPPWVQWHDFPRCPSCQKRMKFLAQFDYGCVYYAFICSACEIAATMLQSD